MSKNRVWENSPEGKEWIKNWREENKERLKILNRNYIRNTCVTLKLGKRIHIKNKPPFPDNVCSLCGKKRNKIYYHHWDDSHPEWGIWVCNLCHRGCEMVESGLIGKYLLAKDNLMAG